MGEEPGRYLYIQTMDCLYSVSLNRDNKLSKSLNVAVKFPEECLPVCAGINIVDGQFWMIGGEFLKRGLYYPNYGGVCGWRFIGIVKLSTPDFWHCCSSNAIFRLFSTHNLNGEHRIENERIFKMQTEKPNPISEVIDDMLYVLTGKSLFNARWEDNYSGQGFEVYDPVSRLWSPLPSYSLGFGPLNHFVLGKKLYVDTGLDNFSVFDTRVRKWFPDDGKMIKSFRMVSRAMPKMEKYLKVDNMHVLFGFWEDLPYAYLVSIADDDVDCDDQVYLRCFQPLEKDFFNDGVLVNNKDYIYRGVYVPIGDDKMCCIYSYDYGPVPNSTLWNLEFVICVIVFSVSSAAGKIDPKIATKIFQSEHIQPCCCTFLDIDIISSESYTVTGDGVAQIIRRALIYD